MNARAEGLRLPFDSDREAPRKARYAVASFFGQLDDLVANTISLAVSELVTNVIAHTDSGGEVRAWDANSHGRLRIEVEDYSPIPPIVHGEIDIGGRGLLLVDKLADAWGVEQTSAGKVLWAEFVSLGR